MGQGTEISCYVGLIHQFTCQYYVAVGIATDFWISRRYTDGYRFEPLIYRRLGKFCVQILYNDITGHMLGRILATPLLLFDDYVYPKYPSIPDNGEPLIVDMHIHQKSGIAQKGCSYTDSYSSNLSKFLTAASRTRSYTGSYSALSY